MIRGAWVATLLLLAGCTGLTEERVASVEPGRSTRLDVHRALGEPTLSSPDMAVYVGADGRQAVVYYDSQGVVAEKFWWPPEKEPAPSPAAEFGK
jgi:hypothetical protein